MPPLSPVLKKALSAVAVAAASAGLVALNAYVVKLPEGWQGIALAAITGLTHYLNAWGSHERALETVVKDAEAGK